MPKPTTTTTGKPPHPETIRHRAKALLSVLDDLRKAGYEIRIDDGAPCAGTLRAVHKALCELFGPESDDA